MTILDSVFQKKSLVLVLAAGLLVSCGGSKEDEKDDLLEVADTVKAGVLNIAGELFSVPSPVQTAMLVQKSGVTYDKNILSSSNQVNNYSTDFSKALNLGIYGADLGYVSLYNQTQDALGYLASIKQLSDKLGLSAAFDSATMERIKNNITNKDSMMVLVGIAYRGSDAYLKDNQRTEISSLILTGGWIESMHFSLSAYKTKASDQIKFRVAEQKQALNSIVKILKSYDSQEIKDLHAKLEDLKKVYDGVQFKYQFVEPVTDTIKKITYINSTTEIIISDAQLKQIAEKLESIRENIVNTKSS